MDASDNLVSAYDQNGNVVWERPQDEWIDLMDKVGSDYRTHLRSTWLYPSSIVALVAMISIFGGLRIPATLGDGMRRFDRIGEPGVVRSRL